MVNIARKIGSQNPKTSDLKSTVKKQKPTSIKPTEAITRKYYCCSCGKDYNKLDKNFPKSHSPFFKGNEGYLPICNHCFDAFTDQYQELLGSQDDAIKRMCLHWDMYIDESLLGASKKVTADRSRIRAYVSKSFMQQYSGKTYDDYIKEQSTDAITSLEELEELQGKSDVNISKNSVKIWGFGFSPNDYEFLNNQFSDWKAKCIIEGKAKESLVRELCIIKLQQNKSLLEGKIDLYSKLTETFQKTLDRASLTPKMEEANEKAGEKPMGVMIDMFENDMPVPEPLPEWKDVDGIVKMFTIYFLGHLCKMLGIKNRYSRLYEDEMARYRVEIPELEDADDEDVFDHLINGNGENE